MWLTRGNHEAKSMNKIYGFDGEVSGGVVVVRDCEKKLTKREGSWDAGAHCKLGVTASPGILLLHFSAEGAVPSRLHRH